MTFRSRPGSARPIRSTSTANGSASTRGETVDTRSAGRPGDPSPFGPQLSDTRVPAAQYLRLAGPVALDRSGGCGRFYQLAHRTIQDVQQRHQDLQAQPFRTLDNQPVDLARGQPDPAPRQRVDQIGGGEHAPIGHHLSQVPAVVEFADHWTSPYRYVPGASSAGPSAFRSA